MATLLKNAQPARACRDTFKPRSRLRRPLAFLRCCCSAVAITVLFAGCAVEKTPPGRALQILPAVLGDPASDPLAVDPAWMLALPDRAGSRAEEVVGFRLFDRYLYPGEPARGLLRINPQNLPWRQRVHFEVWDEPGLNLLWTEVATVQRDESYLVQISPLAGPEFADQALQIRVRANAFLVTERAFILPRPTTAPESEPDDKLAGAIFPVPMPAGPVGPSDAPLALVATPGETISAATVLWPIQPVQGVKFALTPPATTQFEQVDVRMVQGSKLQSVPPAGASLRPGLSNVFVTTLRIPANARPGTWIGNWQAADSSGVIFSRPVSIVIAELPYLPADTMQARYLNALDAILLAARAEGGSFRARLLAGRIERRVDEAANYYAGLPPRPLPILMGDMQFPHKLRWLILRSIAQLQDAGVAMPKVEHVLAP
jgi:hypothetical protein